MTTFNDKTLSTAAVAVRQVDVTGPTYTDMTTEANDATDANYVVFPATEAAGDYSAVCKAEKFGRIVCDYANGTAGIGGTVTWRYLSADGTWQDLPGVVDATAGFTTAAADGLAVTWDDPNEADWTEQELDGVTGYWVAAFVATTYSTNPVLDQIHVGGFDGHADRGRVAPERVGPSTARPSERYRVSHASLRVVSGTITSWRLVLWDGVSDTEVAEIDNGMGTNVFYSDVAVPYLDSAGRSAEVRWLVTGQVGVVRCVIDGKVA